MQKWQRTGMFCLSMPAHCQALPQWMELRWRYSSESSAFKRAHIHSSLVGCLAGFPSLFLATKFHSFSCWCKDYNELVCSACQCPLTVKHFLNEWNSAGDIRPRAVHLNVHTTCLAGFPSFLLATKFHSFSSWCQNVSSKQVKHWLELTYFLANKTLSLVS